MELEERLENAIASQQETEHLLKQSMDRCAQLNKELRRAHANIQALAMRVQELEADAETKEPVLADT